MSDILHRLPEFLSNHLVLTLAFIGALVALVGVEAQRFMRGYAALTPAGLTQLINRENAVVIDVSSQQDFEKGHVPGARHVAPGQLDPSHKELAKARELPLALVCRNGQASARAARSLHKAGFPRVFWLEGGLAAWNEAHMPLATGRA